MCRGVRKAAQCFCRAEDALSGWAPQQRRTATTGDARTKTRVPSTDVINASRILGDRREVRQLIELPQFERMTVHSSRLCISGWTAGAVCVLLSSCLPLAAAQGGIVVKLREGANDGLERNLVATRSGVPKIHAIIAGVDVNVVLDSKV